MSNLIDQYLLVEGKMERRLAGLAIFQPKAAAQSTIRPQIDQSAITFFKKFDERREEILKADTGEAIRIAFSCCEHYDFYRFFSMIMDINTVEEAPKFGRELVALRTARKAIRWVEESGLLERWIHD